MTQPGRTLALAATATVLTMSAVGCGGSSTEDSAGGSTTLSVFAASSLKATFTTLGQQFEQQNPGTRVAFTFAGSSDLATQITNGAPADVFASADEANMTKVSDAKLLVGTPTVFATNTLTIVVPANNPAVVRSFADLARPGTQVVVCAPQVPCGAAAEQVEQRTGTTLRPVSEESSVADVLTKVTTGEADAGLVYVTEAKAAGATVQTVPFPESGQVVNRYPVGVLGDSDSADLARRFAAFVSGPVGGSVLRDAGFGTP